MLSQTLGQQVNYLNSPMKKLLVRRAEMVLLLPRSRKVFG